MNLKQDKLFESFTFPNGATIANRLMMAPMTTNSAFVNGMVTTDELNYYARRSEGLGAVITACAHVLENGRFSGSLSVASDNNVENLKKLADAIHEKDTKAILQIFHVGRMGTHDTLKGQQPVSASAVKALRDNAEMPLELSHAEVLDMINAFGEATRRAIEAGFDGVELHGANTYLIQQFFSPHSNRRTDEWGGTLEKRMAFPLAVIEAAKDAIEKHADQPFILGYRVSPEELEEPGITLDDTLALLNTLKTKNLDYIHLSLANYQQTSMRNKAEKTNVLEKIAAEIGNDVPLIGVGQVHTEADARQVLKSGAALVAIGRQLIVEPDWVEKVKRNEPIRSVIKSGERDDLAIPDMMWEYVQSRPGWLPIE